MKLTFLGTKGYIEESSKRHQYHSSLLLKYKKFRLLIDHGLISKKLNKIKPDAILITHAHPDAFIWVKKDEKYEQKIYVTRETKKLARFKKNFEIIKLNRWFKVGPFKILAYRVIHSVNAPAVGFKIKAKKTLIYNSDLVAIKNKVVLKGVDFYIGDGSSVRGNLIRRNKEGKIFGHARIKTQLNWCKKYQIKNVIITHLGKEALRIGDVKLLEKLKEKEVKIKIARDGMGLKL